MSAEQDLYTVLSGNAGVMALVSTRIYPDIVPEDAALPAIAYQRAQTEFVTTIHGGTSLGQTVVLEVSCVATTRAGALALANAVVAAMNGTDFYSIDQQSAVDYENGLWGSVVSVNFNE